MKKLLSILGAIGLTATSTTNLVACDKPKPNNNSKNENNKP
ncbi:lipoprotein [Spiroplasma endosymbiont of Ammophila pubescens]